MRRLTLLALFLALPGAAEEATSPAPLLASPKRDNGRPVPTSDPRVLYALGLRGRYLGVPSFLLSPFLQQYTTLNSESLGAEFIRRKGTLDVVLSLDYSLMSPPAGNFLGANKDPTLDTHYVQFPGLSLLSLDVSFIWTHDLARWLAIMVGGGVGIGAVLGDIYVVNNSQKVCTASNAGDPNQCYPIDANSVAIQPTDPNFQRKLEQTATGAKDVAQDPHYHKADRPPVMVVVNFILGFKFKIHRHFNLNLSGGFRDGFVVGLGPEVVF